MVFVVGLQVWLLQLFALSWWVVFRLHVVDVAVVAVVVIVAVVLLMFWLSSFGRVVRGACWWMLYVIQLLVEVGEDICNLFAFVFSIPSAFFIDTISCFRLRLFVVVMFAKPLKSRMIVSICSLRSSFLMCLMVSRMSLLNWARALCWL